MITVEENCRVFLPISWNSNSKFKDFQNLNPKENNLIFGRNPISYNFNKIILLKN